MSMTIGRQTGSLVNHLLSSASGEPPPKVGLGATVLGWTDRKAGTIVEVGDGFFVVQLDTAKRTDSNGMSDAQSYSYTPNPNGARYTFKRVGRGRCKGYWRENGRSDGSGVCIGVRDQHHDYSF